MMGEDERRETETESEETDRAYVRVRARTYVVQYKKLKIRVDYILHSTLIILKCCLLNFNSCYIFEQMLNQQLVIEDNQI